MKVYKNRVIKKRLDYKNTLQHGSATLNQDSSYLDS